MSESDMLDDLALRALRAVESGATEMTVSPIEHFVLGLLEEEEWSAALIRNGCGPIVGLELEVRVVRNLHAESR